MKIADIRTAFLNFFQERGHQLVPSSSLVPVDDPTLLFTNAGMAQFKDVFLGKETRRYQRAVTVQKVVRAGGKHNDLENVGYTARHHTFFEMLGNFSFGDYDKANAIEYAWTFATQVLGLPKEKIWVTVYQDDEESYSLWRDGIGVPESRLVRLGADSNFWSMGDTGPCGPCTEMFYDHGPEVAGGPPGSPDEDGDRFIEFWNVVFMQYERSADGSTTPLPKLSVDTGMGLERVAAIVQGVHNNYDIDLFKNILAGIAQRLGVTDQSAQSLKVLADHVRSSSFLIADGVLPDNEGRGYVLRRIIRRALRHGKQLGAEGVFFADCVAVLVAEMGNAYPELVTQQAQIEKVIRIEEEKFLQTLEHGMRHLAHAIEGFSGDVLPGEVAFTLYDTYGFPVDLTADVVRERGMTVDLAGFDAAMDAQRQRSQKSDQFGSESYARLAVDCDTRFVGYAQLSAEAKLLLVAGEDGKEGELATGQTGSVVLDQTPFYAESGGQIGDRGVLTGPTWSFQVSHTSKNGAVYVHHGRVQTGTIPAEAGQVVQCAVDTSTRQAIARHHSATHLLHAALRQVVGSQVEQKGSLVTAEQLRFDFSSFEPVSPEQLRAVEQLVNAQIMANTPVETALMSPEAAKAAGAMALFGEKYGEEVRVLSMGVDGFSVELCGGTHVKRTGDIGVFRIRAEGGVASGVRRIEALVGFAALTSMYADDNTILACADRLKAPRDQLLKKLDQQLNVLRQYEKEVERLKAKLISGTSVDLIEQAVQVGALKVLAVSLPEPVDGKALRAMADQMRQRLGVCAVVLASELDGKVQLVATVSESLTSVCPAGDLVNHVAAQVGGKGGGTAHMAMAGGQNSVELASALRSVPAWVASRSESITQT
ncbi:MAG: alanine--tRNA ligase [Gammaproteobacteria bacterium]